MILKYDYFKSKKLIFPTPHNLPHVSAMYLRFIFLSSAHTHIYTQTTEMSTRHSNYFSSSTLATLT